MNAEATTPADTLQPPNPCTPSAVTLGMVDLDGIEGRISGSLNAKVRKLIDDDPDRALEVVRAWMAEDDLH
jgi:flagellar biosynthesis/type III secretory pathway M-ring protein FliF/YscJ